MKIFVYTNCQGNAFKTLLPVVTDKEFDITLVENYIAISGDVDLNFIRDTAKAADLFIYQPISESYGSLSTSENVDGSVLNFLKPDCLKVSVPYIYNDALWPMFEEGGKYANQEVIFSLMHQGADIPSMYEMYDNGEMDFLFYKRLSETTSTLRAREKNLDITVSDFISSNLTRKRLFFTQNHPTTAVFTHVIHQFLEKCA